MVENTKPVWIIDDNASPNKSDADPVVLAYVQSELENLCPGHPVIPFGSAEDVLRYLEEDPANELPVIIFIDSRNHNYMDLGYQELCSLFDGLKRQGRAPYEGYIAFMSGELDAVEQCTRLTLEHHVHAPDKVVSFVKKAILQAEKLKAGDQNIDVRDVSWPLNGALNRLFGLALPDSQEAFDEYRIEKGLLDNQTLVAFYRQGKIKAARVLDLINRNNKLPGTESHVEYTQRWHQGVFTENTALKPVTRFEKMSGSVLYGYAVFNEAQALDLNAQDSGHEKESARKKNAVLFLEGYSREVYKILDICKGLVIGNDLHTGHACHYGEAHHMTVLIGVERGFPFELVMGAENELWAVQVGNTLIRLHDPITIDGATGSLYLGHQPVQHGEHLLYVQDIHAIYERAMADIQAPCMGWKANVQDLSQLDKILPLKGIGLLRTEALAYTDQKHPQLQALVDLFTTLEASKKKEALDVIQTAQKEQLFELFGRLQELGAGKDRDDGFPVRLRLFDLSPEEFLKEQEIPALNISLAEKDQRGVQLAAAMPELYKVQSHAMFQAYADYLTKCRQDEISPNIKLEIMVPMVRTVEELLTVKDMAIQAAKEVGLSEEQYSFGMMLETVDAAENIAAFVRHVSFMSVGSNDLSSEKLGIKRKDMGRRGRTGTTTPDAQDPATQLDDRVADLIRQAMTEVHTIDEGFKIDICGAHAGNLCSLEKLRLAGLSSVSVTPSDEKCIALRADWDLYDWWKRQEEKLVPGS